MRRCARTEASYGESLPLRPNLDLGLPHQRGEAHRLVAQILKDLSGPGQAIEMSIGEAHAATLDPDRLDILLGDQRKIIAGRSKGAPKIRYAVSVFSCERLSVRL